MKRTDLLGFTITEQSKAQDLADDYSVEELQDRLDQIYRDMEQEAEPEGGPIADMYADEIHAYEEAIRLKKGKKTDMIQYDDDPKTKLGKSYRNIFGKKVKPKFGRDE